MNTIARRYRCLLCLFAFTVGCQSEVEPSADSVVAVEPPAPAPAAPAKAENTAARTPELANPKEATTSVAAFSPQFPERLELFEPPKRAQGTVRRDGEDGQSVELKGFINVDQPRAILSIDGVISIIPEGGEKYGVRVWSIQPPTVVLERGRQRWPATLE
jgi:hypothetical protein